MSTAAQDEYENLFHTSSKLSPHPAETSSDDDDDDTIISSVSDKTQKLSLRGSTLRSTINISDDDDDEDVGPAPRRSSTYYLPGTYDPNANTGPKGVIADAQAFEQEKRGRQRTFERTTELKLPRRQMNGGVTGANVARRGGDDEDGTEDEEDIEFVRKWREKRLGELKDGTVQRGKNDPTPDGQQVRRDYGIMETVDGPAFLNAIEKAPRGTVVVVYVFDEEVSTPLPHKFLILSTGHFLSLRARCSKNSSIPHS